MKNKNKFFLEKTKSSLKHLGIVAVIISLSVMFSSLCIMSLISLSDSLYGDIVNNPKSQLGGEVKTTTPENLFRETISSMEDMKENGTVTNYAYLLSSSNQYVLYLKETYGNEFVSILGYESLSYPLSDVMSFESGDTNMNRLLEDKNSVIISEMFARKNDIKIGETITLVSTDFFTREDLKVVDFIKNDYRGGIYNVFINGDKLKEMNSFGEYLFYADGNQEKISEELSRIGQGSLTIQTLDNYVQHQTESFKSFFLFIRGVSVLGLFIGSFGIASAIKVIVNKRRRELGILKAIGFVAKDIMSMLVMEVAAISVVGSFVGVALGYAFFYYLMSILSSTANINVVLSTSFNVTAALISFIVSIVSSVLFAYVSIKQVSDIKPIYALRDMDYIQTKKEKGKNIFRFLIIALIFLGISVFLAQSVKYGIGAVLLVGVGLLIFSLLFRFIFWLILRVPIKTHNEVELSWNNLRLNYKKIIISMVAVFVGIASVNLINTLIYSSKKLYEDSYVDVESSIDISTNRANPKDNLVVETVSNLEGVDNYKVFYKTIVSSLLGDYTKDLVGVDLKEMENVVVITEGEQTREGIVVEKNIAENSGYNLGDILNIDDYEFPITGLYEFNYDSRSLSLYNLPFASFISKEKFQELFSDRFVEEVWIYVDMEDVESVLNEVSEISDIYISSSKQFEDLINSTINLVIKFATSIASLALVAGIILIITVTILDVISRRRDLAIYKVIGFKQKAVTNMILLEYGLMTLITSVFANLVVYLFTLIVNEYGEELFDMSEKVIFDLKGGIVWSLGLISLVVFLVLFVSRETVKVKPSEVLRYE